MINKETNNQLEKHDDEISLIEIWNKLWKNKFLIIIIAGVFTIITTFGLYLINKSSAKIEHSFNYEFINVGNQRFADGSRFNYKDLATKDFLTDVIASDPSFSNVDIKDFTIKGNSRSISIKHVEQINLETEVVRRYFQIHLSLKPFDNDRDLAESFILAIHKQILDEAKIKNEALRAYDYFAFENKFGILPRIDLNTLTYPEIISLIKTEYGELNERLSSFIDSYGNVVVNGVSLTDLKRDLNYWYDNEVLINQLNTEIIENNYIKNLAETKRVANLELIRIDRALTNNLKVIADLTNKYEDLFAGETGMIDASAFTDEISKRMIANVSLEVEKDHYTEISTATSDTTNEVFDNNLKAITVKLSTSINTYNDYYVDYLNSNTRYEPFGDDIEFEVVKQFNMMLMLVVLGLIGGIIGVSTALIKEAQTNKDKDINVKQ